MKNTYKLALAALTLSASASLQAEDTQLDAAFEKIWSYATLYNNPDNSFIQKFAFTGRLQGDYFHFDEDDHNTHDDTDWRRVRTGFKAKVFNDFTIHSEADLNLTSSDSVYNRLTEAYIAWHPSKDWKIKVGKHSAGFTLDGATSSKKLIAIERSKLTANIWFTAEYFTGASLLGKKDNWKYKLGVFSNASSDEMDHTFSEKYFALASLGYDFGEQLGFDKTEITFDYVHNDESDEMGTKSLENVYSLSGKWDNGKYHTWANIAYAEGFSGNDLFGFELMPFYDITEKLQGVLRYTYVSSSDDNGVGLSKYEKDVVSGKGNEVNEYYAGINYYLFGHKLKWQNGIQYTDMQDDANDGGKYRGWGYTSAIRISW